MQRDETVPSADTYLPARFPPDWSMAAAAASDAVHGEARAVVVAVAAGSSTLGFRPRLVEFEAPAMSLLSFALRQLGQEKA